MQREDNAVLSFRQAIEANPLGYDALALLYKAKGEVRKAVAVLMEYLKSKKAHKFLFGS
jgi:hypothetical protein